MMVSAKKLIQGSVIYMKKMRVSKRGFTLTEIIIVVAIMVIVASAAFVGVAVALENARKNSDEVNRRHGRDESGKELFEAEAWEEIDELTKDAANFFDVSMYKPAKPTSTPAPTATPTTVPDSGDPGTSPTPTTKPDATATPLPTSTTEPTPTTGPASGNVSWGTTVSAGNQGTGDGKQGVISASTSGNVTTFYMTRNNGWDASDVTITEVSNGKYKINLGCRGMSDSFKNDGCPDMNWGDEQFDLTNGQKTYLKDKYGIVLK
jgi:prepilin-type N-terminal cleavage/methylation domain-containing protein